MNRLDHALTALEKGHELVICHEHSKVPIFKNWPERTPDAQEAAWWIHRNKNWAIKAIRLVVVDKDASSRKAYDWMRHRGIWRSPMQVETRRGIHVYFRLPQVAEDVRSRLSFAGLPVDLLTGRRAAMGPGSTVIEDGVPFTYALREGAQIVAPEELPVFPIDILQPREEVRAGVQLVCTRPERVIEKYLLRIDTSEQGKNGSRACFVAALKCLSLASGDAQKAWEYLVFYNRHRCDPPWDEDAEDGPDSLRRKLREALKVWKPRT